MKPTVLKMKAFGSYANETIVDFNRLNSGLYLITGDTGAGKTTIFDAMVFALYGEASGDGRDTSMLHSDFVPKSEDTLVSLEFVHHGKTYKVEREIHFTKSRTTGEYVNPTQKAVFYEEGETPIEVATKVTNRVSEVIGLDSNQFKQIIVLAQGEFQKFLKANSVDRNKILGKLFDNSPYIRFEARLKAAAKYINSNVDEGKKAIQSKMSELIIPEDENEILYAYGNPDYMNNLDILIEKENRQLDSIKQNIQEILRKRDDATKRLEQANHTNKALDRLNELAAKNKEYAEKQGYFDEVQRSLDTVEKANSNVSPARKALVDITVRLKKNEENIKDLEGKLTLATSRKASAEEAFREVDALNTANSKMEAEQENLNNLLKEFEPLNQKNAERRKANNELENLKTRCAALERSISELSDRKKQVSEKIESLKEDVESLASRTREFDAISNRFRMLTGKDGLIDRVALVEKEVKTMNALKAEALKLNIETIDKKEVYDVLYNSFIRSQAAILAKELKVELEDKKEAYCPVCHNHLSVEDAGQLAVNDETLVTKDQVDRANEEYKKAEGKYRDKDGDIKKQSEKINQLKNNAMSLLEQLDLEASSFDELSEDYLSEQKKQIAAVKDERERQLRVSESAVKETRELNDELRNIDSRSSETAKQLEASKKELGNKQVEAASLTVEIKSIEDRLNGQSESSTKEQIALNNKNINANKQKISSLSSAKEKALNDFNTISGSLVSLKNSGEEFTGEFRDASSRYQEALAANGFFNEEEYLEAIACAGNDVSRWIMQQRKSIQSYRLDSRSVNDQYEEQKKLCRDAERVDEEKIREEAFAINQEYALLSNESEHLNALINNHKAVSVFVKDKQSHIGKYLPASERLTRLSSLANADINTAGGKITFDRYVMGQAFKDILDAANVHLRVMASGQYVLVHQTKGSATNTQAGLDIEVLDVFTNEQRKPDSLSGGEKFQVSMALALGLSDVVQNRAGGKKIDTMYIDEGFGTLDEAILGKAIEVLKNIAGDTRQIGIISHVDRLEESISQKIVVRKSDKGSSLHIE